MREPRSGSDSSRLDEAEFRRRFRNPLLDPAFYPLAAELDSLGQGGAMCSLEFDKHCASIMAVETSAMPRRQLRIDIEHEKDQCDHTQTDR